MTTPPTAADNARKAAEEINAFQMGHAMTCPICGEDVDKCPHSNNDVRSAIILKHLPAPVAVEEALQRFRYAVAWVAADSWDHCSDCRARLEWAQHRAGDPLSNDELAAIGQEFLEENGAAHQAALAQPKPLAGDWVAVPREPTPEMQEAAEVSDREYTKRVFGDMATVRQGPWDTYVTMISAAPAPSAGLTEDERALYERCASRYPACSTADVGDLLAMISRLTMTIAGNNPNG